METPVKDPVCGMEVKSNQNEITYLGMQYAFCSRQCQQRFLDNPRLYIGLPGRPAPKQLGEVVIKSRRMQLDEPLSPRQAETLIHVLGQMMGVTKVTAEGDRMEITYDLLQVTAEQIEAQLVELGIGMGSGWAERLRRAFVHYQEECQIGNMEVHREK